MGSPIKRIELFILAIIILLGTLLRFIWLDKSPPSLNWDEAALGYNAYSLAKTGQDEFGVSYPFYLRSFDDYKPALYSYLTVPFIKIFGISENSVRAPSAISGVSVVVLIFLLAKTLFPSTAIPLISAFLVSVEPWAVHFSRVAFEANLGLALFLAGVYFLVKSHLKTKLALLGLTLTILSAYAYHAGRLLVIPALVGVWVLNKKGGPSRKMLIILIITALVLLSPLLYASINNQETLSRLNSTSILKVWQGLIGEGSSFIISALKLIREIIYRYLSYFSPANLFVRGTPEPTQHIPLFGMFYLVEFIFWIIGIFLLIKNFKRQSLLSFLVILSPLPAIITWNWFYPARVLPLFSFFSIIIAWGIYQSYVILKKKIGHQTIFLAGCFITYLAIQIANLATSLLFYLPYKERGIWQYGMKQIVSAIAEYQGEYNRVVFETRTAQPHIFLLFYSGYLPEQYHQEIGPEKNIERPRKSLNFGKFEFRDVYWPKDQYVTSTLLIGPTSSLPSEKIQTNPRVILVKDITDSEGNFLARLVGLN